MEPRQLKSGMAAIDNQGLLLLNWVLLFGSIADLIFSQGEADQRIKKLLSVGRL